MISKANIQLVKSLQDKKQRQKYDQFIVEGEKSITELLTSNFEVLKIFALPQWIKDHQALLKGFQVFEIELKEMKQISSHQSAPAALALVKIPSGLKLQKTKGYVLALDEIQDPGNMGSIIRIADWYGIKQIICSKGCTDVYAPKCINSTMGSFLRVNVHYGDILESVKFLELPMIVTTLEGENIHHSQCPDSAVLVIGNEGHGINDKLIEQADMQVTIPRFGMAESLNAAVSTAIILDNLHR